MREWVRLTIELTGAALVVVSFTLVNIALGLFVAGVIMVAIANFYLTGDDDAGPD
ncbi:MAG: hypothetical protein ACR2NO_05595 [Chloroflexota bacterium]